MLKQVSRFTSLIISTFVYLAHIVIYKICNHTNTMLRLSCLHFDIQQLFPLQAFFNWKKFMFDMFFFCRISENWLIILIY